MTHHKTWNAEKGRLLLTTKNSTKLEAVDPVIQHPCYHPIFFAISSS